MNTITNIIINILFALIGITYLCIFPNVLNVCESQLIIFYCTNGGIILICSVLYGIVIYLKHVMITTKLYNSNILKFISVLIMLLFGLIGVNIWGISLLLGSEYGCYKNNNIVLATNTILLLVTSIINVIYMTTCYNILIHLNTLLNNNDMYAAI